MQGLKNTGANNLDRKKFSSKTGGDLVHVPESRDEDDRVKEDDEGDRTEKAEDVVVVKPADGFVAVAVTGCGVALKGEELLLMPARGPPYLLDVLTVLAPPAAMASVVAAKARGRPYPTA